MNIVRWLPWSCTVLKYNIHVQLLHNIETLLLLYFFSKALLHQKVLSLISSLISYLLTIPRVARETTF